MGDNIFVFRDWCGHVYYRFFHAGMRPNSFFESSHTIVTPDGTQTVTQMGMQTNQDVFDYVTNQWCVLTSYFKWNHDHCAYLLQGHVVYDNYGNILA